mgnify:CR=1 FL=1
MRKIILAATAGALGLVMAAAPAAAISSYQIQSDGGANFNGAPNTNAENTGGLSITSTSSFGSSETDPATGLPVNNFEPQKQQNLSGDMSWEGTGYYLRPER